MKQEASFLKIYTVLLFLLFATIYSTLCAQPFTDITTSTGLPTNADGWSLMAEDFNQDGKVDLVYSIATDNNWQFFKNNGNGTFTNATMSLGLSIPKINNGWIRFVDFNKDGYKDIVYANQQNNVFNIQFLKNQSNNSYLNYTAIAHPPLNVTGSVCELMDYNSDGTIDIVFSVGNSMERSIRVIKSRVECENIIFDSVALIYDFTSLLTATTVPIPTTIADFDNDGDPDIVYVQYCSVCGIFSNGSYYNHPHGVVRNDGNGNFVEVTSASGLGSMPLAQAAWDYNNDGIFDLISGTNDALSNYSYAYARVWRGDGNCHFTEQTTTVQLYDGTAKYLTPFVGDINNDFELDVYERVAGFGNTPNMLYVNNGNAGAFQEASAAYGLNFGTGFDHNQGAVWFDIEQDGDKDLVLIEENAVKVMRNNLTGKNWIKLTLNGCQSNKDALGIKVVLKVNNKKMVACKGLGTGQNQVQADLHFGLNTSTVIDSITVYWSNSIPAYLSNVPANQVLNIDENSNCVVNHLPLSVHLGNDTLLCLGETLVLNAIPATTGSTDSLLYKWSDGSSQAGYLVKSTGSYSVEVRDNRGCTAADTIVVAVSDQSACAYKDPGIVYNQIPPAIFVPGAFSPNHDGVNDELEIFGKNFNTFKLMIYNRWGEIIFISENKITKWDGTYRGEEMQIGTYPWVLYYNEIRADKGTSEQKVMKGSVTLIR